MIKNNFVTTTLTAGFVSLVFFSAGCSGDTVSNTANTSNTNRATINSNSNSVIVNTSPNNTAAPNVSAPNMNSTSTAPNSNRKPVSAVKEPTPQIGSGANDLLLFTQSRSALGSEKELESAVIIEVKDGNVTLSGKVSNAEQKAKAEQLIKVVNGVKTIKNNISVTN